MFTDKRIVVTGGSSGAGRVLAGKLASRGAHIALIARDPERLESAAAEIRAAAGPDRRVAFFSCDVAEAASVEKVFERAANEFGTPHMLINSAGILREGYFEGQGIETFREMIDVNFFGTLHCIRAVLPHMKQAGGGRIVNIASMAGLMGIFGYSAYCASKYAVVGLTAALRAEFQPQNIRFHVVCPPEFESPMVDAVNLNRTPENERFVHTIPTLTAEMVADQVIRGIERDRYEIIPGFTARALARMDRHFPALGRAIADAKIRKHYRGPGA